MSYASISRTEGFEIFQFKEKISKKIFFDFFADYDFLYYTLTIPKSFEHKTYVETIFLAVSM